jgi:hypothetical protein
MCALRPRNFSNDRDISHDLDNIHPLLTSIPSNNNPHKILQAPRVLTPVTSPSYENDNIRTVAPSIPHSLSTSVPSNDSPHQVIEALQVLTHVIFVASENDNIRTVAGRDISHPLSTSVPSSDSAHHFSETFKY